MTEPFELPNQTLSVGLGVVAPQQVVGAELGVGALTLQHVVGDDEDGAITARLSGLTRPGTR